MTEDPITKVVEDRDWLKPSEVGRILNAHITTVYRWIDKGQLQAIKTPGGFIWRIPRTEVEKALELRVRQHKQQRPEGLKFDVFVKDETVGVRDDSEG